MRVLFEFVEDGGLVGGGGGEEVLAPVAQGEDWDGVEIRAKGHIGHYNQLGGGLDTKAAELESRGDEACVGRGVGGVSWREESVEGGHCVCYERS